MLIVAGEMSVSATGLAALRSILATHRRTTEAERGCVRFTLGIADEAAGRVSVLQMWRSERDLLRHQKRPHMALFMDLVGPHIKAVDVHIYDCGDPRPWPTPPLPDQLRR